MLCNEKVDFFYLYNIYEQISIITLLVSNKSSELILSDK